MNVYFGAPFILLSEILCSTHCPQQIKQNRWWCRHLGRMRGNTTHYLSGHWQHGLWCIFCFIWSSTVNRQQVWFNFHYKNSFKVLHVFLQPWLKAKIQLEKNISVWRLEKLKSSKNVSKQWMTTDHWHWPSYFALCSTLPLLTAHCANFTLNTSVRPNFYTVCIRS